jgi:hypothetical protein
MKKTNGSGQTRAHQLKATKVGNQNVITVSTPRIKSGLQVHFGTNPKWEDLDIYPTTKLGFSPW